MPSPARIKPSLRPNIYIGETDYLLLSQHEPRVEHYARQPDGAWRLVTAGPGDRVPIASLGIELAVDELYAGLADPPG